MLLLLLPLLLSLLLLLLLLPLPGPRALRWSGLSAYFGRFPGKTCCDEPSKKSPQTPGMTMSENTFTVESSICPRRVRSRSAPLS